MTTSLIANGCLGLCESKKQDITRERKLFSEIYKLKTFGVEQRPRWLVQFVARTSYADARLVTNTQTDKLTTVNLVRMRVER